MCIRDSACKTNLENSINELSDEVQKDIGGDFQSDFIKLFHHGSISSSTEIISEAFLKEKKTTHIAVSSGTNQKYKHPHQEALEIIKKVAKKQKTKVHFYGTNPELLQSRGGVKATIPKEKLPLMQNLATSRTKHYKDKKYAILAPEFIQDSKATRQANENRPDGAFLGYRFKFDPANKKGLVKVAELIAK